MSLHDIWHFSPKTWHRSYEDEVISLSLDSDEAESVKHDLKKAIKNIRGIASISRVQNIYDFGQFLMRGQILVTENENVSHYEVRRYVAIPKASKDEALRHNLDHRRLGLSELYFKSHLEYVDRSSCIFVVKILTTDPEERSIKPYNFTEYYIDYVVDITI